MRLFVPNITGIFEILGECFFILIYQESEKKHVQ
jgi:hypothetical protein